MTFASKLGKGLARYTTPMWTAATRSFHIPFDALKHLNLRKSAERQSRRFGVDPGSVLW